MIGEGTAAVVAGLAFGGFVLALVVRALMTETASVPWRERARSRRTVRALDVVLTLCGLTLAAALTVVVVVSLAAAAATADTTSISTSTSSS